MNGLHDVTRTLTVARDEQLARVVAVVDALPERGAADDLIAPLRPRLAMLRPTRPLNVTRLLFTPLDPLIVPLPRWRRGTLSVPRSTLAPLAELVQRAVGPTMDAVAAELLGVRIEDTDDLGRLGSVLWPAAAFALTGSAAPPGWHDATGIPVSAYPEIAAGVRAVLSQADALWRLRTSPKREEAATLQAILTGCLKHGVHGLGCVMRVLLVRHPNAARVLSAALQVGAATDAAVDAVLADGLPSTASDVPVTPATLTQMAALLNAAEAACTRKDRRDGFERLRRHADSVQQERFMAAMEDELIAPARTLGLDQSDEAIVALEESARTLRRLEIAGRTLGSGDRYDAQLHEGATAVAGMTNLRLMDRVRLVEILAGSDQAAALLQAGRPG